ncbi:hypothetical protein B0H10DRAFT_2204768 [Mycena sp. CBHHK59/15]|nr:hypothetical protein B0H10DRAFT_2204768 [Mycena sp. CBHHK59/15]
MSNDRFCIPNNRANTSFLRLSASLPRKLARRMEKKESRVRDGGAQALCYVGLTPLVGLAVLVGYGELHLSAHKPDALLDLFLNSRHLSVIPFTSAAAPGASPAKPAPGAPLAIAPVILNAACASVHTDVKILKHVGTLREVCSSLSSSPFGSILYTCTDATSRRCTRTARYGRRHPQGASQSLRDAEGLAGSAPIQMDADAIHPVERAWDCWASWDKADQCRAAEVAGSEELRYASWSGRAGSKLGCGQSECTRELSDMEGGGGRGAGGGVGESRACGSESKSPPDARGCARSESCVCSLFGAATNNLMRMAKPSPSASTLGTLLLSTPLDSTLLTSTSPAACLHPARTSAPRSIIVHPPVARALCFLCCGRLFALSSSAFSNDMAAPTIENVPSTLMHGLHSPPADLQAIRAQLHSHPGAHVLGAPITPDIYNNWWGYGALACACGPAGGGNLHQGGWQANTKTLLFLTTMGIKGLWKELEHIEQKISLHNLAVGTGFIGNATGRRTFRVGIDASGWIYRACYRHGSTQSPELVALFSRCSRLFRLPFVPLFVFDGPNRPSMKRGKVVRGNDHWLTADFKRMLDGFGFKWAVAPGEAEAELAAMSNANVVDAILTDDSDSFVFGASIVLRIRSEDNENYEASRYSAFDIASVLGLSREDFILIALLAGGDYSDGLSKCGITIAIGLAHAGLGRKLISGLSGQSGGDAILFLRTWCGLLRSELSTNTSGHLPHQYPQLAAEIPSEFPDLDIINLYLHPLVSEQMPAANSLHLCSPWLDVLACFAEDHFTWGSSIGILAHFADQLFAGLVIRELVQQALVADGHQGVLADGPSIIKKIVGTRNHKSTGYLAELRLLLSIDTTLLTRALGAIVGDHDPHQGTQAAVEAWIANDLPKVRVWVPKSMVEHLYPSLVLDYISSKFSARTGAAARRVTTMAQLSNAMGTRGLPAGGNTDNTIDNGSSGSSSGKAKGVHLCILKNGTQP